MSILAPAAFVANAKSIVVMNRLFTEAENAEIVTIKGNAIAAGEWVSNNSTSTDPGTGNTTYTGYYSNIATANAVVAAYLAFDPAPVSATASAV